jgi:UDP-glucose 4-epimerase
MQKVDNGQILITGGSGVLGSYITDLIRNEYDVVIADTKKPQNEQIKFVNLDLTQPFTLSRDFEICIHLAAFVGGIQFFTKHPVENIRDNPRMTSNLLDAANASQINQVLFASSSVVYQHQTQFPTPEDSVLTSPPPSSAYGMSKLVGEYMCRSYNEQFGLNYTILRPFNIYGPKEAPDPDYAHVIPELIRKVLSGQYPVQIFGTGNQSRTFTHGKDAATAFQLSIQNKKAFNETFNVSGDEEIDIHTLLEIIWRMTGNQKELRIDNLPALPHDVQRRFPSNNRIKEILRWKPEIELRDGLYETIEWIRNLPVV